MEAQYNYDLFISYGRSDADRRREQRKQPTWVQGFKERLIEAMQAELGEDCEIKVFLDSLKMDGFGVLADELEHKVKTSRILLFLVDQRTLNSDWCIDELNWFREGYYIRNTKAQQYDWLQDVRLVCYKPITNWPQVLRRDDEKFAAQSPKVFHNDKGQRYGRPVPHEAGALDMPYFNAQIEELALEVVDRLVKHKQQDWQKQVLLKQADQSADLLPTTDPKRVFIGYSSKALEPQRQELAEALSEVGFNVSAPHLDYDLLVDNPGQIAKNIRIELAQAALMVQPLGELQGPHWSQEIPYLPEYQIKAASERECEVYAWSVGDIKKAAPAEYRGWLNHLKKNKTLNQSIAADLAKRMAAKQLELGGAEEDYPVSLPKNVLIATAQNESAVDLSTFESYFYREALAPQSLRPANFTTADKSEFEKVLNDADGVLLVRSSMEDEGHLWVYRALRMVREAKRQMKVLVLYREPLSDTDKTMWQTIWRSNVAAFNGCAEVIKIPSFEDVTSYKEYEAWLKTSDGCQFTSWVKELRSTEPSSSEVQA